MKERLTQNLYNLFETKMLILFNEVAGIYVLFLTSFFAYMSPSLWSISEKYPVFLWWIYGNPRIWMIQDRIQLRDILPES
jgi:hypothetical protein